VTDHIDRQLKTLVILLRVEFPFVERTRVRTSGTQGLSASDGS
jgi:hypothetical protein